MKIFRITTFAAAVLLFSTLSFAQTYKRALMARLDTILETDQYYRSIKAATPEEDKSNMNKQDAADLINLAKVEKIISEYGYPGKSMVGTKHQSTVFLVIQHNDTEVQEKYYPLLKAAVKKGELRASSLAIMLDRIQSNRNKKQTYGSQLRETKDGVKIWPIEDERNVNIRRAKIGLQPLEQYYREWKINYKVPTAKYSNPASIYFHPEESKPSTVEAIGGDKVIFRALKYPQAASEGGITGKVTVEFTIDTKGNTKDLILVKGLGYGCDEEALRVIKNARYVNTTGEDHVMRINLPFPYKERK